MDKLYICIPAYNEEDNIRAVANEWYDVAAKTGADSRLIIIDDGSKDNTYNILMELKKDKPQLIALSKANGGHGDTVLYAYKYALENGADYVFQTDSDGQTSAEEFWPFWETREKYNALIGSRIQRQDGFSRVIVTKVLKALLFCIFRLNITDANTPFRLIKAETLRKHIANIPPAFNLSNVMLTVSLVKYEEGVKFKPITFKPRQGGKNSINIRKIIKIGLQAVSDFRRIQKTLAAPY